jgi:hypothetical protein
MKAQTSLLDELTVDLFAGDGAMICRKCVEELANT